MPSCKDLGSFSVFLTDKGFLFKEMKPSSNRQGILEKTDMIDGMNTTIPVLAELLDSIIEELGAKDRRQHERRMKELQIIENSSLKDEYVRQLLLDRLLSPIEQAQHEIQNRAKHAQWLAGIVVYYHQDHGLSEEQAHELARQLRLLAIQITNVESLHDLKFVYAVITIFVDKISVFKHKKREYRLEYSIRDKILNPLNTCIATERNFIRRIRTMEEQMSQS